MALGCAALLAATAAEMRADALSDALAFAKRTTRVTLDLPKHWVPEGRFPDMAGREVVPCPGPVDDPLVVVAGGQSNAANSNSALDDREPRADVLAFHDGACTRAASPMPGATGVRGSLWPALGDALADGEGRPVVLIVGAVGGTEFSDWLDPRSGYLPTLAGRIEAARARGLSPDVLLWHQGETDAAVSSGRSESEVKLARLADRLLAAAPEASLYLFRTSRCRRGDLGEPVPFMIEAQTAVAEAHPRIHPGMDTDALGDDFRWDGCHFNSLGRTAIVEEVSADLMRRGKWHAAPAEMSVLQLDL